MVRTIQAEQITQEVAQMCKEAAYYLPGDVFAALERGRLSEKSPVGREVLDQIITNAKIAKEEDRPICQDTGMTIVFVELGQDVHIEGGNLNDAINAGVAKGYTEGYLRKSVVAEPLFDRKNTQDNTPAVIYTEIVPGDKLTIQVEPKGFGSENKSGLKMLVPADGVKGVKKAVMDIILHAAVILAHQWLLVLVLAVLWTVLLLCLKKHYFVQLMFVMLILNMQNLKKSF